MIHLLPVREGGPNAIRAAGGSLPPPDLFILIWREEFLAKIAPEEPISTKIVNVRRQKQPVKRLLVRGEGWSVFDVLCASGPHDQRYEEQHSVVCIAIVTAGSFQYRSSTGQTLMTPGALLLGNAGEYFECGHEHATGDRCISFSYEPSCFEHFASEAGVRHHGSRFSLPRVPPIRELSPLVARSSAYVRLSRVATLEPGRGAAGMEAEKLENKSLPGNSNGDIDLWREVAIELAARVLEFAEGCVNDRTSPAIEARITRVVRMIERSPDAELKLDTLAREANLSRYHSLRVFQQITGVTPHQYILRSRLRRAAATLLLRSEQVLDVALDSGFGDVSNFNHAFRAEFGVNPKTYRKNAGYRRPC